MRAFIAIELDAPAREALARTLDRLQSASPPVGLKWVRPEHQHLTLHFFGDLAPERVGEVEPALRQAASRVAAFELNFAELGCFPNAHKPNVFWLGVHEPSGALIRLYQALNTELARVGFEPETRAFTPHLTLARVPRHVAPHERRILGEWFVEQPAPAAHTMHVTQVHFVQSVLLPAGPKYTILHVATLSTDNSVV